MKKISIPDKWALTLIIVLVGTLFAPYLTSGRNLAPFDIVHQMFAPWRGDTQIPEVHNHFVTDAVTQYIPYRMFAEHSFQADGYIGWNPLIFGGTPQYANTMGLYFDWTMQLHRFLSFWKAWHAGLFIQFVLAGIGMFFFLRSRDCSSSIALMAALAYMTNWQFVAWIYHRWALGSFCWMPWVLWAMEPWLDSREGEDSLKRRSLWRFTLVPVFLALSFLGGTLQHAVFVVIACLCVFAGSWWDASRRSQFLLTQFGRFAAWGTLAVGLAGIMFVPSIQAFLENNATGHVRGAIGYESGIQQPILNALSYPFYIFPFLLGSPRSLDFWKAFSSDMFNVGFFGTIPMVLSGFALFHRNISSPAKILIVTGLLIPLTPLVGPLYHRVNLVWILGGCWAAAELLARSTSEEILSLSRKIIWALTLFAGLWLFVGAVFQSVHVHVLDTLTAEAVLRARLSQFGYFSEWIALRSQRAGDWILPTHPYQFAALGLALLAAWSLRLVKRSTPGGFLLAIAVFFQTTLFWWIWTTWSDPAATYAPPYSSALFAALKDSTRLSQENGGRSIALAPFPPNTLSPLGIAIAEGYDSIHPRRMISSSGNPWEFPGTTHYLAPDDNPSPPGWTLIDRPLASCLFKNPRPDPIFSFTKLPDSEPSSEPRESLTPVNRTFNRVVLDIPTDASEIQFLENWSSGWHFRFGDHGPWQEVSMARNHSMFITVPNDRTSNQLNLQFFPFSSIVGPAISLLAAIALLLIPLGGSLSRMKATE